jgi:hypothetical protein
VDDSFEGCLIFVMVVLLLALFGWFAYEAAISWQVTEVDATVVDTFVSDGETFFIIEHDNTGKQEVISNGDNIMHGKFNSNDFYSRVKVGEHYRFQLTSKRIPFLSLFRNILDVEEYPLTNDSR